MMNSDYPDRTQRLILACFDIFSELMNIAIYRNMHRIAVYRDIIDCDPCIVMCIVSRSPCVYPLPLILNIVMETCTQVAKSRETLHHTQHVRLAL